jgi:hypothetical protein
MHGQRKGVLSEGQDHVPGVHDESFFGFGETPRESLDAIGHSRPGCGGELGFRLMSAILHFKCKVAGQNSIAKEEKSAGEMGRA